MFCSIFQIGLFRPLSYVFVLSIRLIVNKKFPKTGFNREYLVLEATALPTEPQHFFDQGGLHSSVQFISAYYPAAPDSIPKHIYVFFELYSLKLSLYLIFECEENENKQKEAGIGPFLKILFLVCLICWHF